MTNENNQNQLEDGLPEVAQSGNRKNPVVLIVVFVILALAVGCFLYRNGGRSTPKVLDETYAIQPDLQLDDHKHQIVIDKGQIGTTAPIEQASPEVATQQLAMIQEKQKELQQRLSAPLMLVNTSVAGTPSQQAAPTAKDEGAQLVGQTSTPNVEAATTLGPLNTVIAQGGLIHAVLESASNSDLPGFLRAIVSEQVYSEDGSQVLIPRGSRLVGQYKNGILQGQTRIFVVWSRLITPAGISLNLGSPGVDNLGVAGMGADEINRHFWERFGTASLLSMIGAGTSIMGAKDKDKDDKSSSYLDGVSSSFVQSANQSLRQDSMIAPTLKTYQGKDIIVFVAHDLNFQSAMKMIKPKINVF